MDGPHEPAPLVHAATRFTPPRLRREFVVREALVGRVLSPDASLVVVSGPAGSGKSTLLAQAYTSSCDAVWLSIETFDNDPAVLWSALIDSTARTVRGFGEEYRHRLDTAGAEAVDSIVPLFVNELARTSRPIRFFIDDLHLVSGERSIASVDRLLHLLPGETCLVIASRAAAPFPLGRLRMQRAVVEIGPTDLAMDVDEARATSVAAGVELDDEALATLVERTEGWVAGLAWATMAMQDAPDARSLLDAVDAVDSELATYLVEEVLDQRSPELRAFMLDTAILSRFNAAMCDEVRGRNDSRELIDELARTNSFLVSLDRPGEWFRYHHLVHDVLAARLGREAPDTVPTLHRRASSWLSERHEVVESIRHARAAGDHIRAADILCGHWWELMNGGRIETAHALFDEFGHDEIRGYQPLAIAAALLYSLAGDHEHGQAYYQAAESGHFEGSPPDGCASIESALAIMRGSVAFDGVDASLVAGREACELEPVDSKWRPLAVFIVAIGHIWRGELDAAEPKLEQIIGSGGANEALIVYALAQLALIRLARGDVDGAMTTAESACARATESGLDTVFVTALAHGAAAAAKLSAGDVRAADHHLDAAAAPMAGVSTAMPIDAMQTRLVLADAAIRLGRITEAQAYVTDAGRTTRRYADTGVLSSQLAAVRRRLEEAADAPPARLTSREQEVLELMPAKLSVREIADALYVSTDTVKTHRRRIYQKLNVNSRADAVIAARRAGLLPEHGDDLTPSQPV